VDLQKRQRAAGIAEFYVKRNLTTTCVSLRQEVDSLAIDKLSRSD
jgi:hypothetical protein